MRLHFTPQSKLRLGLSLIWLCKHSLFAMPEGVQEVEVVVLRELHEEDLTGMLSTSNGSISNPQAGIYQQLSSSLRQRLLALI